MATNNLQAEKVLSPKSLAHVVIRTNNFEEQRAFYISFLGGREVHGNDLLSFIAYDDEHHRIALLKLPGTKPIDYQTPGLEHIAFTFDSLRDLCTAYKQRKARGMLPGWCVNHGPTTSMYYRDVDGNQVEAQVDNFDTAEEATACMLSPEFAENTFGADFDPEELCAALDRGVSEAELKKRKNVGPRGVDDLHRIMDGMRAAVPKSQLVQV